MEILYVFLLGLVFGSFAKLFADHLSLQKSVLTKRSCCDECHHVLAFYDLIPVFSWLHLKGKCRYCGKPISLGYPISELFLGTIFVFTDMYFEEWTTVFVYCTYFFLLLIIFIVDVRTMRIPYGLMVGLLLLAMLSIYLQKDITILNRMIASCIISIPLSCIALIRKNTIGGGDILLFAVFGLLFGISGVMTIFVFTYIFSGIYALYLLIRKKINRKHPLPMLPFMMAASLVYVFSGIRITLICLEHI